MSVFRHLVEAPALPPPKLLERPQKETPTLTPRARPVRTLSMSAKYRYFSSLE